jgi:hypothetical protein
MKAKKGSINKTLICAENFKNHQSCGSLVIPVDSYYLGFIDT